MSSIRTADVSPTDPARERRRIFLSYARRDAEFTRRLAEQLEQRGYLADFDQASHDPDNVETGIAAEDEWWKRLEVLIASADVMVFLISPDSAASSVCDEEIAYARGLGKRVIAAIVRPVDFAKAPPRLAALNAKIDFSAGGDGARRALDRLCAALELDIEWQRQGRRLAQQATEWHQSGRAAGFLLRGSTIAQAEAWAARRPDSAPPPGELVLAFLSASRELEDRARDHLRSISGRAFVEPIRQAIAQGEPDRAVRMLAAAAILSEDAGFDLVPALWRAGAGALARAPLAAFAATSIPYDARSVGPPLAISHDGERVASMIDETTLALTLTGSGRLLWRVGAPARPSRIRHSRAGAVIALYESGEIHVHRAEDGAQLLQIALEGFPAAHFYQPATSALYYWDKGHICEIKLDDGAWRIVAPMPDQPWEIVANAPGSAFCALLHETNGAVLIGQSRAIELAVDSDGGRMSTFSLDGSTLAIASRSAVSVHRASDGARLCRVAHGDRPSAIGSDIHFIALSDDGKLLLSGAADSTARLWSTGDGRELQRFDHVEEALITEAVLLEGGALVATNGTDCTVRVWEVASGKQRLRLSNRHQPGATDDPIGFERIAVCADQRRLVTTTPEGLVQTWRLPGIASHALRGGLTAAAAGDIAEIDVRMRFDGGASAAVAMREGVVQIIDVARGEVLKEIAGHGTISRCRILETGDAVVVSGGHQTRLLKAGASLPLWSAQHEMRATCLAVRENGSLTVVGSGVLGQGPGRVEAFDRGGKLVFSADNPNWISALHIDDAIGELWVGDVEGGLLCLGLEGQGELLRLQFARRRIDAIGMIDGTPVLLISDGAQLWMLDQTGGERVALCRVNGTVRRIMANRDRRLCALVYFDHVQVVDLASGALYLNVDLNTDPERPELLETCALAGDWSSVVGWTSSSRLVTIGLESLARLRTSAVEGVLAALDNGNDLPRDSERRDVLMHDQLLDLRSRLAMLAVRHQPAPARPGTPAAIWK